MNAFQSFKIALDMLRLHKLRAFLTMLGVIIGVMAVTIVIIISQSFQSYMTDQFKKVGARTITIVYAASMRGQGETNAGIGALKQTDVDFIRGRVPALQYVTATLQVRGKTVSFADKSFADARIYGNDLDGIKMNVVEPEAGRLFTQAEVDARASVCVIGEEVRKRLFGSAAAVGSVITVGDQSAQIVGVAKLVTIFGESNGKDIYFPNTTLRTKWIGNDNVDLIQAMPYPNADMKVAMDDVWAAMMSKSGNRKLYRVDSSDSILAIFNNLIAGAGLVLSGVAALSLLVGGIGIMNIMLVSVTERTREIGLRKALGARRGSILLQFLVEAGTLSLVGGFIGMSTGYLFGTLVTMVTKSMKWPTPDGLATPFPLTAALMAMAFSALIGMVFGFYPALSASRLSPIVALRKE